MSAEVLRAEVSQDYPVLTLLEEVVAEGWLAVTAWDSPSTQSDRRTRRGP